MAKPLNRPEVEFVGEVLIEHLRSKRKALEEMDDPSEFYQAVDTTNRILRKMDHPLFEE